MSNKLTYLLAAGLLIFVFIITGLSIRDDSLTMDELAHLPAGYSYLMQKDMRLNPEHPPLIKDISALPLMFIKDINFPHEIEDWKNKVNGQWGFGAIFLFNSNNPAERMIFWGRIAMILLLLVLGFYLFLWTKQLYGNKAGLLALFLFSFCPTLLAHGRLVTTDVGAAVGVFIATYYFIKFLKTSTKKNLIYAGLALGVAQLLKFSLILLFPFFGLLILVWAIIHSADFRSFLKTFGKYLIYLILVVLVCFVLVWAVYQFHTWGYPPEKQVSDTQTILSSFGSPFLVNVVVWMADKPVLRPMAQYTLGVFMILQRASGGNTGYFIGEISRLGWRSYFPFVYLVKETLAFHILTLIALLYAAWMIRKPFWQNIKRRTTCWIKAHFAEFSMILFMGIYWTTSLASNLNIGVRHLLPIFPFTILLVSYLITLWIKPPYPKIKKAILAWLLLWQAYSVLSIYPYFITYFNELVGGPERGYLYVTDSNLDWGQDLKRLNMWANENNVDKIYLDYFGGSDKTHYLKEKYAPWWGTRDPKELPKGSYLAVSATFLQGGRGKPAPGFDQTTGFYLWLNDYDPVAIIGHSIFVYYID